MIKIRRHHAARSERRIEVSDCRLRRLHTAEQSQDYYRGADHAVVNGESAKLQRRWEAK